MEIDLIEINNLIKNKFSDIESSHILHINLNNIDFDNIIKNFNSNFNFLYLKNFRNHEYLLIYIILKIVHENYRSEDTGRNILPLLKEKIQFTDGYEFYEKIQICFNKANISLNKKNSINKYRNLPILSGMHINSIDDFLSAAIQAENKFGYIEESEIDDLSLLFEFQNKIEIKKGLVTVRDIVKNDNFAYYSMLYFKSKYNLLNETENDFEKTFLEKYKKYKKNICSTQNAYKSIYFDENTCDFEFTDHDIKNVYIFDGNACRLIKSYDFEEEIEIKEIEINCNNCYLISSNSFIISEDNEKGISKNIKNNNFFIKYLDLQEPKNISFDNNKKIKLLRQNNAYIKFNADILTRTENKKIYFNLKSISCSFLNNYNETEFNLRMELEYLDFRKNLEQENNKFERKIVKNNDNIFEYIFTERDFENINYLCKVKVSILNKNEKPEFCENFFIWFGMYDFKNNIFHMNEYSTNGINFDKSDLIKSNNELKLDINKNKLLLSLYLKLKGGKEFELKFFRQNEPSVCFLNNKKYGEEKITYIKNNSCCNIESFDKDNTDIIIKIPDDFNIYGNKISFFGNVEEISFSKKNYVQKFTIRQLYSYNNFVVIGLN